MQLDVIEIEKRTKARKGKKPGTKLVDIKPHICAEYSKVEDGLLKLGLRLPSGVDFNLNTGTVFDAFSGKTGVVIKSVYTKRTAIICADGEDYV